MTKYKQIVDGDIIDLPHKWIVGCCSCGLVHRFEFRRRKNRLQVQVFVEPRRTAAKRRALGIKIVKIAGKPKKKLVK